MPRFLVEDTGLFVVLVILLGGIFAGAAPANLAGTFYLATFIHVGLTLYVGTAAPGRTATWLLLIGGWAVSEIVGFAGYVLPWGMVRFWLAAHAPVPADTMQWLSDTVQSVPWPAVLLVLLVLDAVAMHQARWRRRAWWQLAGFVAGAAVVAVALGWALSGAIRPVRPAPTAFIVLPPWHQLPLFAVLRAIPNKLMAVSAVLAMPLLPLAWPWVRADRLRAGRARWIWAALCGALALAWIGLGYLGSRPADDATLIAARALTIFHFTFFLAVPFVLHRVARTP